MGCYTTPYIKHLPCSDDGDCLHLTCKDGFCGGPAIQETNNEPKPEPAPEPAPDASEPPIPETECQTGTTRPCYTGPSNTQNKGSCQDGTESCVNGSWSGACAGEQIPATETCNGKDDDCDGQIDNGFDIGTTCEKGMGACKQEGKKVCKADGKETYCDAQPGQAQAETCNGKDDNCDGQVDETFPEVDQPCTIPTEKGICQNGKKACEKGAITCAKATQPKPEECNGKDDDCDGNIDEVQGKPLTKSCYPSQTRGCQYDAQTGTFSCTGICKTGIEVCTNGKWSNSCQGATTPKPQVCNMEDNDCDGARDEPGNCRAVSYGKQCNNTPCPTGYTCSTLPGDRINRFCFPNCTFNGGGTKDDTSNCPQQQGAALVCLSLESGKIGGRGICVFTCNAPTICPGGVYCRGNAFCHDKAVP